MRGTGARRGVRSLAVLVSCCVAVFVGSPAGASGEALLPSSKPGASLSPLAGTLAIPQVQSLDEAQQVLAAEEARRSNPAVVAERKSSRTQFEGLDIEQARQEAAVAFPGTIDEPAGGPPRLPAGQSIVAYPLDNVAQVNLGEGKHGVLESTEAMAVETSSGRRTPLNLHLTDVGGGFRPTTSLVGVVIPKRLSDGVQLPGPGVSLTPVDAQGVPLAGSEGLVDGASVLYANTQTDSDTIVKPATNGFETDSLLRSIDSPEQLYFRIGLPVGAKLVQKEGSSGQVEIVAEGAVIGLIPSPEAMDAVGTPVPVSMSITGDTLVLKTADIASGKYQYPVEIDPVYESTEFSEPTSNWHFIHNGSQFTSEEVGKPKWKWTEHIGGSHKSGEWGALANTTQGDSYITRVEVYGEWFEQSRHLENLVEIVAPSGVAESKWILPEESPENYGYGVKAPEKEGGPRPASNNSAEYLTESNGEGSGGENKIKSAGVEIAQETSPEVHFNTTSSTVDGQPNVMYGTSNWLGPKMGAAEFIAEDKGIGVSQWWTEYSNGGWNNLANKRLVDAGLCSGLQCPEKFAEYITYSSLLPNGETTLGVSVQNGVALDSGHEAESLWRHKVKVDATPPSGIVISGLGSGNEIGEAEYNFKAEATDSLSGIKSIAIAVDGHEVGQPTGSCSGSCTAKGEWSINGGEFGAGEHKLTVTATDNAGNVAPDEITLKVHHATPVALGPGSVDLWSGEFDLGATDVSVGATGSNLAVVRSYRSRHLTAGSEGPLGSQWSLSVGGQESITKLPNGSATLTSINGAQATFTSSSGGKFASPSGDANLALSEVKNEKGELTEYVLLNASNATTTRFTSSSGPSASLWRPTRQEGPSPAETVKYIYQTVEGVTEPAYALAPEPAGLSVSCITKLEKSEALEKGCRALKFKYASTTTAGENQSEWKDYKGRLKEVLFIAYNPSTKAMTEPAVADYSYDKQGRLRAEWDPRISPTLKTTYGYDAEGHVTSVTPPGQQPWLLHYGTITGDLTTGRLLSVTRPAAGTEFGNGIPPANTVAPTLSSTKPAVGTKINVSTNGTWSNSPLSYNYQWEDCNSSGKECSLIAGAVNQSYYPVKSDEGHTLVAQVSAINATGSVTAASAVTSVVASGTPTSPAPEPPNPGTSSVWTVDYQIPLSGSELQTMTKAEVEKWGQTDDPAEATAIFPPDEPMGWPAKEYKRATIEYFDSKGRTVNVASPTGGVSTTEYNTTNDVVRTLSPDNRATALKESCESKEKCKSSELAKLLDSESTYEEKGSEPGVELLSALGPQHSVQLTNGSRVEARAHEVYSYNEGAPAEGSPYHLVTKTTQGALLVNGEEKDVRTTLTSYNGQKALGWKLRKPTSVTTDPTGLDLTTTTEYDKTTGNVIETKAPAGTSVIVPPPVFSLAFGEEGSGNGQFKHPVGVALDESGGVWIDDQENNRVEKFSSSGAFVGKYGSKGAGVAQFESPWGITVNQGTGNVYVSDSANHRIEELNSSGAFVEVIGWGVSDGKEELEVCKSSCKAGIAGSGNGQLNYPQGLTIDSHGDLWVEDYDNNRVEEFSEAGAYLSQFGSTGSGNAQFIRPTGIAIAEGEIYVVDSGNDRVEEFSPSGTYLNQFGSLGSNTGQLKDPMGIAVNPNNADIYVSDEGNNRVEEFSPSGKYLVSFGYWGTGAGQFEQPTGLAINASGDLYTSGYADQRVEEWVPPAAGGAHMTYSTQFGTKGAGSAQFDYPGMPAIDGQGNVWVADWGNSRIEKFTAQGKFLASYGSWGTGEGQFKTPFGIAINQSTSNIYIADCEGNRIEELSSAGSYVRAFGSSGTGTGQFNCPGGVKIDASGNVWVADIHNNRIEEFSSTGSFIATYGTKGSGNGQFNEPIAIAISGSNLYVTDSGNHRVQELSTSGTYIGQFGSQGNGGGQFDLPETIATDSAGHLYIADTGNERIEEFSASGQFLSSFGSPGSGDGQLNNPQGITINPAGDAYVTDSNNNRIEIWATENQSVHDTKTIYYTAKGEAEVVACREHPEWAGLSCETQPAAQPEDGLPELPTTTTTYNVWDEPEITTETVGSKTRTKTNTYDAAGRLEIAATSSTVGTSLPTVTYGYTAETGAETGKLTTQRTTVEGKAKKITNVYNALGQLTSYTDAAENTATYEYDADGRIKKTNDGKGTQTYTYNSTTGLLSELVDSSSEGMKFTATYDVEGDMLTEGYPNGMTATYTYNSVDKPTGLEYKKLTHCTEKCTWFSDVIVPSIHDQWLEQTSMLSHQAYTYDAAGRLIQTQSTPAGEGCTTQIYAYDEDTNRTSLTTREPNSKKECAEEGGTTERHTYDEADRLTDSGTSYNTFGDITTLPAADAGGSELKSEYYVDNQLQSQTQKEQTIGYTLDPAGRTFETISTGKPIVSDITSHYAGPGNSPAWTINTSGETTRNIPGINGQLAATQEGIKAPVLQLTNLHGDIVATASKSETATELASKTDTSEYGVPTTTSPLKYSWLGANEIPTELPSGIIAMGARSYVPQLGRFLQPDPVPGGSANAYSYTFGDPVNSFDLTGEYVEGAYLYAFNNAENERSIEREAAREAAARAAAEAAARRAEEEAERAAGPQYGEGPLGGYGGWLCQDAAETGQEVAGCGGGRGRFITDKAIGRREPGVCYAAEYNENHHHGKTYTRKEVTEAIECEEAWRQQVRKEEWEWIGAVGSAQGH